MFDLVYLVAKKLELAIGWVFSPSWLPPQDFVFLRWLIVPGYGYGFILITLAILEMIVPYQRRPWNRASWLSGTYLLLAGKMGIYTVLITPLIRNAWVHFGLPSFHLDRMLPLPLYIVVALLVITFADYWAHRGLHRIPALWHIHKIHHSVQNLNCSSIYHKHFLELILHTPLALVASLGLGTELVAPFGIIVIAIDVLGHSNVRLDLGRLSYIISTPQAHRTHHSAEPRHYDTNFGTTFMLWDHVFGTFCYDPDHPPTRYGLDTDVPVAFLKQQVLPLWWIAKDTRNGLVSLRASAWRYAGGVNTGESGRS